MPDTNQDDSLDAAIAAFEQRRQALKTAVATCEREQAAGRIGIEAYSRARILHDKLAAEAVALQKRIADALVAL